MSLVEEILILKALVASLLERVSQLEAESAELRLVNIALQNDNLELKTRLSKNFTNTHKRPIKTKQKVSACFKTIVGANHYARIQGFISNFRKQGMNPFLKLQSVF